MRGRTGIRARININAERLAPVRQQKGTQPLCVVASVRIDVGARRPVGWGHVSGRALARREVRHIHNVQAPGPTEQPRAARRDCPRAPGVDSS